MEPHRAKISSLIDRAEKASTSLSDINRKLCYSLIAVVWIMRDADKGLSENLTWVLVFVIASLTLDFGQYLYQVILWRGIGWTSKKENTELVDYSPLWEPSIYAFWILKIIMNAIAVGLIAGQLFAFTQEIPK